MGRRARSPCVALKMTLVDGMLGFEAVTGLLASAAMAAAAVVRGSLSRAGGIAAVVVGTTVYAGGGPFWFTSLLVFFLTSTLLGRVGARQKAAAKREFAKSDRRDAWQVVANGGVAAACAIAFGVTAHPVWAAAFVGALAAANADTWATELGVLSRREPWLLLTFQRVARGTSGAVSPAGLAASVGGAVAIGIAAAAAPAAYHVAPASLLVAALVGGIAGSLSDSLLGATLQAGFHCPTCRRRSESPEHACGTRAARVRGLAWLDNDGVNLVATATGALLASGITIS